MRLISKFKRTLTWQLISLSRTEFKGFLVALGNIGKDFMQVMKYIIKFRVNWGRTIEQSSRFAVDSLPITLTIVGMTAIIISMQISPELAKQGGGDYIGMLSALVMVRELGAVMAGFAIISMIGSSFASEIASMSVTDQISAMKVLKVDPIEYLVVPRFVAGFLMMPFVVVIASFVGLLFAGIVANMTAEISALNFVTSMWYGFHIKDIFVALLKSAVFGGTIALISCSWGYSTRGGAKEVGIATTKAVVWSFLAIAIWDYIFASIFYL
jgi:phospholipid/cholesterol/gamma-HCH transport system permease protein